MITLPVHDYLTLHSPTQERCGLVLPREVFIEIPNTAEDKANYFCMSEEDMSPYSAQAIGTWHTHTHTNCNLTMTDYNSFVESEFTFHFVISSAAVSMYSNSPKGLILVDWRPHG